MAWRVERRQTSPQAHSPASRIRRHPLPQRLFKSLPRHRASILQQELKRVAAAAAIRRVAAPPPQHVDADYFHHPNEVNVWLPLTRARDSNALWAESAPGAADFRPFALRPGAARLFYGHQVAAAAAAAASGG